MSVFKRKKTSTFFDYDFWHKGQRFRDSTGQTSLAAAKRVEAEVRQKAIADGAIEARDIAAGKRSNRPLTLFEVTERYWERVAKPQVRSDQVLWSINWLLQHLGAEMLITDIDADAISKLVTERRNEKVINVAVAAGLKGGTSRRRSAPPRKPIRTVSPARINRSVVEPLRKIMYFARDTLRQHIQPIKWKTVLQKEPAERIRIMKPEQEAAILPRLPEQYHPLVYVKKRIGPRIFELLKMQWSDIDWEARRVEIEGKGGFRASVPLPMDVRDALWALPRRSAYVFTNEDGLPMTYNGIDSAWNRACAKAGVNGLTLHALRHTAATNLLKTTNLKVVQKMLRHRDIRSTLRYAHADDADVLAALEASTPIKSPAESPATVVKSLKLKA